MRAIIETELILDESSTDQGLVTWFAVRIVADQGDTEVVGRARVARVHVGQAADVGERLHDVLDADSAELEALYGRRLCDTLGQGCELAAMPYESEADAEPWQRLGFSITTPGQRAGYLHLPLGARQARVVPNEDFSSFKIVANPPPGRDPH